MAENKGGFPGVTSPCRSYNPIYYWEGPSLNEVSVRDFWTHLGSWKWFPAGLQDAVLHMLEHKYYVIIRL